MSLNLSQFMYYICFDSLAIRLRSKDHEHLIPIPVNPDYRVSIYCCTGFTNLNWKNLQVHLSWMEKAKRFNCWKVIFFQFGNSFVFFYFDAPSHQNTFKKLYTSDFWTVMGTTDPIVDITNKDKQHQLGGTNNILLFLWPGVHFIKLK